MADNDGKSYENDDLDDLLEKEFEKQDQFHPRCRICDNTDERKKRWNEKYKKG